MMKSLLGVTLAIAAFGMLEPCAAAVPDRSPTDPPAAAATGEDATATTPKAPSRAASLSAGEFAALSAASAELSSADLAAARGDIQEADDDGAFGDSTFDWAAISLMVAAGLVYLILAT